MTAPTATILSADDLRARIRAISVAEPNPARITDQILRSLAGAEFRVVASVALHYYVQKVLQSGVGDSLIGTQHLGSSPTGAGRSYETPTGGSTPSSKLAARRDWVERDLLKSICVDEANRQWEHLGECSIDQLRAAAANRRRHAESTAKEAERLDGIAKACEHAGADKPRDLPRDVLEAVLRP